MSSEQPAEPTSAPGQALYDRLWEKTREVADKALDRLRDLGNKLPNGVLEQIERLHDDPESERRKATRVGDSSIPVEVQEVNQANTSDPSALKDHGPTGLAVRLPCPTGVGTHLRIRMPQEMGGRGWVTVEVKYCRKEAEGWIAGCELLSNQPPI